MVLKYLCAAALNKADCVQLHHPARTLSSASNFKIPQVKLGFLIKSAEDQSVSRNRDDGFKQAMND